MSINCANGYNVSATNECKEYSKNEFSSYINGSSLSLLVFSIITGTTAASAGLKNTGTIMLILVTMMVSSSTVYTYVNWSGNKTYVATCLKTAPKC